MAVSNTRTSARERLAVKTVACPVCDAQPTKLCRKSAEGCRVRPHLERTRLAPKTERAASKPARKSSTNGSKPNGSKPAKPDAERSAARKRIIAEELARKRSPKCRCGISENATPDDLRKLEAGCTAGRNGEPGFVCPTLDAIRRRVARPASPKD